MESEQTIATILSWDTMLPKSMKKYIHYRSMKNFALHYDEIKNIRDRGKIANLLSDYIEEVKESDFSFERHESAELIKKYVFAIAGYYKEYSNFMKIISLPNSLLFGLLIDSLLYLAGLLSHIWQIPIATVGFLLYHLFVSIFKEPKGRVYGMFY